MLVEVKIPIRTHLKKYILKRYSTEEPIMITKKSIIGKFIIQSFGRQRNKPKSIDDIKDQIHVKFDHEYDIVISDGNVYDFNDILEDIYRKDLALFVGMENLFNPHPEKKHAVELFNDKFKISEDDISLETLLKHLQRHVEDTKLFDFKILKKVS